jgi:hypothetical protein
MKNPFIETKSNWRSKDWWPEMKYFRNKIYGIELQRQWLVLEARGVPARGKALLDRAFSGDQFGTALTSCRLTRKKSSLKELI